MTTASSVVGLASLVKVILAAQHGVIPPQCNYSSPNPNIEAIREGKVIVVTDPTELQGIYYTPTILQSPCPSVHTFVTDISASTGRNDFIFDIWL